MLLFIMNVYGKFFLSQYKKVKDLVCFTVVQAFN